jgi:LPS-assembly lipoprotein
MSDLRLFLARGLAAIALMALAGCGFEPIHAARSGKDVTGELAAVRVGPIPERSGQVLRNYLLDRLTPLGQRPSSQYVLNVRLNEPRQTLALRRDDIISRASYSATASFELLDGAGKRVTGGVSSFSTDYEITSSEYATLVSLQSARDRVLELVGDDIRGQLAAFFRSR